MTVSCQSGAQKNVTVVKMEA